MLSTAQQNEGILLININMRCIEIESGLWTTITEWD